MADDIPPPWISNIRINSSIVNDNGASNAITTTKYSLLTWLPKSLWEQFRRIANIYFIFISILMLIGTYAPYIFQTPLDAWSTVSTLAVVLLITSIKEGAEDYQRYKSDKEENNSIITIVTYEGDNIVEKQILRQDIKSGDIIKLQGKMSVPVDMLLLITSNYADGNQCYIETSNIDGETNLKLREAPSQLMGLASTGHISKELLTGYLEFEPPNKNIHNFVGALHVDVLKDAPDNTSDGIPLSADNLVLRSSLFCNTDWAYGIAVYTGQETKIQMNNRFAPSKIGRLELYLNTAIIIIFIAQLTLVAISVGSLYGLGFQHYSKLPYVYPPDVNNSTSILPLWLEQSFVFFLLYNNFIPISLYVTIELVNVGQGYLIGSDAQMYNAELDVPCVVKASNLCQELGMVSNVFSDKTGTLTKNEMKFVKFVVDGGQFDVCPLHKAATPEPVNNVTRLSSKGNSNAEIPMGNNNSPNSPTHKNSNSSNAMKSAVINAIKAGMSSANNSSPSKMLAENLFNILRCLITCHTIVREKDGTYRAESPDELALVEGIGAFDCALEERGRVHMRVSIVGEIKHFEILAVNAFNADRKRMSILIKEINTDHYYLMCKGADNIMIELCTMSNAEREKNEKNLLNYAILGLRTLCIAHRRLTKDDALDWLSRYRAASASLNDRVKLLALAATEIESDMEFLGVTAIEDRLQDEVPEVIAEFAVAGITVWMLTGDKEETAVSIGRSCNLLQSTTKTHFISRCNTSDAYQQRLEAVYNDVIAHTKNSTGQYIDDNGKPTEIAIVMDGPSFRFFDDNDESHVQWLITIGRACRSVIACRLTPIQKQMVVRLVKRESKGKATTLAVGDGANDVSMIREANVGVGIFGKEGRQAANSADFAIGEFKYLRRLLLVHGRYNYSRQARVFLYSMHKNMVLTLTLFWYSYYTAMSGTSLYESWVYTGFNFILGLPIIFYGILDRDLTDEFQIKYPQTYATGKDNAYLSVPAIASWILNAMCYAVVVCLFGYYVMEQTFEYDDLFTAGTAVYTLLCNSMQMKVLFLHHQIAWLNVIMMAISVFGMLIFFYILNVMPTSYVPDYYNEANYVYATSTYWFFCFISVPIMIVLIDLLGQCYFIYLLPAFENLCREYELKHLFSENICQCLDTLFGKWIHLKHITNRDSVSGALLPRSGVSLAPTNTDESANQTATTATTVLMHNRNSTEGGVSKGINSTAVQDGVV